MAVSADQSSPPTASEMDSWTSTDFKVFRFTHHWVIRKFPTHYASGVNPLESPVFSSGQYGDACTWRLKVNYYEYPQGSSTNYIRVYLVLVEGASSEKPVLVDARLGLLDRKHNDSRSQTSYVHETKQCSLYKLNEITSGYLVGTAYPVKEPNDLLSNGDLVVFCEVTAHLVSDIVHTNGSKVTPFAKVSEPDLLTNLSQDFGTLLQEGFCCDVTIIAGGEEFKVHRCILSARSKVFRAMFEHKMKESEKNVLTIEDFKGDVVREMLAYIYGGKTPNLEKMVDSLLSVADKYELDHLKLLCEKELSRRLTSQNVAETLVLADKHNAAKLKSVCTDFIAAHAPEVMDSPGWSVLIQHHEPMTVVMRKLLATTLPSPK